MRRSTAVLLSLFAFSCGQASCSNGCVAIQPIPGGVYSGPRADSVAAARLTGSGFDVLNMNASTLLQTIAPGGELDVPLACSVQNVSLLGNLVVGDQGSAGCTMASCGLLDGKCDSKDVPKTISVVFNTFILHPQAPDIVQATADVTISTNGKLMISTPGTSVLCLFSNPAQFSVDLDTARVAPPTVTLTANIQLTVDTRWWKLLTFEVESLDGTKACGTAGASPSPACIDSADMIIAAENSCSGWLGTVGNIDIVKDLILGQITTQLQSKVQDALAKTNCRPCGPNGECPALGVANSVCQVTDGGLLDAGVCYDSVAAHCVPGVLGIEGRIPVGTLLAAAGAPQTAAFDLSIAAGGDTVATDAGFSLGFTGGAMEVQTAACVAPVSEQMLPMLPLPDFDADADGPYDLGVSLSQQMLSRLLLHAQQSGAMCLELSHDTISLLDSSLVGTLLPSLNKLTDGLDVPLRVVIRPVNPPTATLGSGEGMVPLINLVLNSAELDVYALLDDRYARLFTVQFDLTLPLSLSIDGCATLTPAIGDLSKSVSNVHALNSEILAEPLSDVEMLVPSLISFAEPALAKGLAGFTLPAFGAFQVQLIEAKGVGNIGGTQAYNHLGVYMNILPAMQMCIAAHSQSPRVHGARLLPRGRAELDVGVSDLEYTWRMPNGFWSRWVQPDAKGLVQLYHPRLLLDGRQLIEVRSREPGKSGSESVTFELSRPARAEAPRAASRKAAAP